MITGSSHFFCLSGLYYLFSGVWIVGVGGSICQDDYFPGRVAEASHLGVFLALIFGKVVNYEIRMLDLPQILERPVSAPIIDYYDLVLVSWIIAFEPAPNGVFY